MAHNPLLIRGVAWLVWRARSLRRRLFTKRGVPGWLQDLIGAIAPLQKLKLLFTALAVSATPEHFFRLTPVLLKKKRRYYASPVQFFLSALLLLAATRFARAYLLPLAMLTPVKGQHWIGVADLHQTITLVGIAILTPVWMILFAAILLTFPPVNFCIGGIGKRPLFIRILDYQVYQRLDWPLFLWNFFYFAIFFLVVFPFVWALIGLQLLPSEHWYWGIVRGFSIATCAALLVTPYSELLRASLKAPSCYMLRADRAQLRALVTRRAVTTNKDSDQWRQYYTSIIAEHRKIARAEAWERRRAAAAGEHWNTQLNVDLAAVYATMPREQLEWLASWGRGTPEEREQLGRLLAFLASHDGDWGPPSVNLFSRFSRPVRPWVAVCVLLLGIALVVGIIWFCM